MDEPFQPHVSLCSGRPVLVRNTLWAGIGERTARDVWTVKTYIRGCFLLSRLSARGCSALVIHRSPGSLLLTDFACMYKIDVKTAKSSLCSTYIHKRLVQNSCSSLPVSNVRLFYNNALFRVIIGVRCIVSGWLLLSHYTVLMQLSYHNYL